MQLDIDEKEFVNMARGGKVIVCRVCRDTKNRIRVIDYFPGDKGTVLGFCQECSNMMNACPACQKYL